MYSPIWDELWNLNYIISRAKRDARSLIDSLKAVTLLLFFAQKNFLFLSAPHRLMALIKLFFSARRRSHRPFLEAALGAFLEADTAGSFSVERLRIEQRLFSAGTH
jgi:hypothetical protein